MLKPRHRRVDYFRTAELAETIGVTRQTPLNWLRRGLVTAPEQLEVLLGGGVLLLKYPWLLSIIGLAMPVLDAQTACEVTRPTAGMAVKHVKNPGGLSTDPHSPMWRNVKPVRMIKDCSKTIDYPDLKTEIRGFWSDTDLYLLFVCPYRSLNLFLPAQNDQPRRGLWDRDVVEMFLGDDWENIRHYREYEIAPTGDWIDLAIDLDHRGQDRDWRSGWKTAARIDENAKIWYAAAKIPLQSVSAAAIKPGTRWRMNLYRIDGDGPDPQRRFMCWQPTCVVHRDPNHVPENFGSMIFAK